MAGKDHRKIMTAIARELLGFIWKTLNKAIQLEDEVSCRSKHGSSFSIHEGESSADICDRPGRTRVRSLRQLPPTLL